MNILDKVASAVSFIEERATIKPTKAIILGTGLGKLVDMIDIDVEISYDEIPHFVSSTVETHAGKLIIGKIDGTSVVCMSGRFHLYEGYSLEDITFPVRVMNGLGAMDLFVSNVAGAINSSYQKGDIMVLDDHINLLGTNPLIGPNIKGDRWPDMIAPYDKEFQESAEKIARNNEINIRMGGVYACISGPSLETRAEYKMLSVIGADAIGMSTVPEVIVAVHEKMRVFACSIITDLCYGNEIKPVDIGDIIAIAGEAEPKLVVLIKGLIKL